MRILKKWLNKNKFKMSTYIFYATCTEGRKTKKKKNLKLILLEQYDCFTKM